MKVTFYAPSGKYYFDVWYPDGKKVTLGYSTNTSAQITYPITKSVDAFGDYIDLLICWIITSIMSPRSNMAAILLNMVL